MNGTPRKEHFHLYICTSVKPPVANRKYEIWSFLHDFALVVQKPIPVDKIT